MTLSIKTKIEIIFCFVEQLEKKNRFPVRFLFVSFFFKWGAKVLRLVIRTWFEMCMKVDAEARLLSFVALSNLSLFVLYKRLKLKKLHIFEIFCQKYEIFSTSRTCTAKTKVSTFMYISNQVRITSLSILVHHLKKKNLQKGTPETGNRFSFLIVLREHFLIT